MSKKKTDRSALSTADLVKEVATQRETVRAFRFGTTGATTRDVRAVRTAKKEVARALTELNRRQREEQTKTA